MDESNVRAAGYLECESAGDAPPVRYRNNVVLNGLVKIRVVERAILVGHPERIGARLKVVVTRRKNHIPIIQLAVITAVEN